MSSKEEKNQKFSILFVGNLPKPIGGIATHCFELTSSLSQLGHEIIFCDTHPNVEKKIPKGIIYYSIRNSGIVKYLSLILSPQLLINLIHDIYLFGKIIGKKQTNWYLRITVIIYNIVKKHNVAIVHSQHCNTVSLAASNIASVFGKPLILTAHGSEFSYEPQWRQYSSIIKHVCSKASSIIAVSKSTSEWIKKRGIQSQIEIIYNGVNLSKFSFEEKTENNIYERLGLNKSHKHILFVGQISKKKGPHVLVRAMAKLHHRKVNACLVGRDSSNFSSFIKQEIDRYNLNKKVKLVGEVSDVELIKLYKLADIIVFPTCQETEGFGLVVVEAMAAAKPVIASRIGPLMEIIEHGENGLLFQPGNDGELAKCIDYVLNDPTIQHKLGKIGQKKVREKFNWSNSAKQTAEVYKKITANE